MDIKDDIKSFIDQNIDSVGQLEVLLLLFRSRHRSWQAHAVSQELRSNDASAGKQLDDLAHRGLLSKSSTNPVQFQYAPHHSSSDKIVRELEQLYRERRVSIINLIYAKPIDRIQGFANAFKIRGDK